MWGHIFCRFGSSRAVGDVDVKLNKGIPSLLAQLSSAIRRLGSGMASMSKATLILGCKPPRYSSMYHKRSTIEMVGYTSTLCRTLCRPVAGSAKPAL